MKHKDRGIIDLADVKYENADGSITTVYGGQIEVETGGTYQINAYPQLKKSNPSEKILKLTLKKVTQNIRSFPADISELT